MRKAALANRARRILVGAVPKERRTQAQRLYRPLVARAYRGDEVECPICGGRFRKFLKKHAASGRPRAGARCARCGSLERHRLLWLYLRDGTDLLTRPARLLHFAPEPGIAEKLKELPGCDYLSADLDAPPAMVRMDVQDIPADDDSFDAVICNHVLEHVPDDRRAVREIRRVLKPGGWAILGVPLQRKRATSFEDPAITSPEERERIYGQFDHVRVYGADYPDRLRDCGFEVEMVRYAERLGTDGARRYGLVAEAAIPVCRPAEAA
jgi:SAM-dependent methyltransferase